MNIKEVRQYKPGERMQIITSTLADIQQRITRRSPLDTTYPNLLKNAYRSIKQWEQETPEAQEILTLAREQASESASHTLPLLAEALLGKFSPEQTQSIVSVGYGTAKKEEQLASYLRTRNRDSAVIGVERDYGLAQPPPYFLSQAPNRSILLNADDERPYSQAANVDGSTSVGLMVLSAHHTLLDLPNLLKKFHGLNGLMLVEELMTSDQWVDPKYRAWRAAVEIFFNYAFSNEMPKDFDFETQFDARYYTREDVLKNGGTIIDIPNTKIPPVSVVLFTKEMLN